MLKALFRDSLFMDKPLLTGQNLGWVFNFWNGCKHAVHFLCYRVKLPKVKLKTRPKHLLGSLPLIIALPSLIHLTVSNMIHQAKPFSNFWYTLITSQVWHATFSAKTLATFPKTLATSPWQICFTDPCQMYTMLLLLSYSLLLNWT
jgi:hypothetical protein